MDCYKSKVLKIILSGLFIFVFGIFVGYQLKYGTISSIQGYLFNSVGRAIGLNSTDANASDANASDANASDANASDANASDANASDANASDANASDANASQTDNIISLQSFSLNSLSANPGEKVYVSLSTKGACNSGASIVFKNESNGATFTVPVNSIANKPYIEIPLSVVPTTYTVTDLLLVANNSDNTTFTKQYSINSGVNSFYFNFNTVLTVNSNKVDNTSTPSLILNSISLDKLYAKINEKVYVNIVTSSELSGLKLLFSGSNNKNMTVYVKSLNSNPYFEIPSTVMAGNYFLTTAVLSTSTSSVIYTNFNQENSNYFDFNLSLEINDGSEEDRYLFNNEEITSEIITKLYNANNNAEIVINADSNPIINLELFNLIKGKNKKLILNYNENQMIFIGNDILNAKTIDVSMSVKSVNNTSEIGELVKDGIVVNFASNGNLPGKALVRIKATDDTNNILGNNKVYVYYYNKDCKKFSEIANNVKKTSDGYYEFCIEHNSDYILVDEILDDSLISDEDNNVVSFQKSNKVYLLLIAVAFVIIIGVTIAVVSINRNNNKNKTGNKKKHNINKDLQ